MSEITEDILTAGIERRAQKRADAEEQLLGQIAAERPELVWELVREGPGTRLIGHDHETGEPRQYAHVIVNTRSDQGERLRSYSAYAAGWAPPTLD